jgi:hypothetical protein
MNLTTLTYNLALRIRSGPSWDLDKFVKEASCCDYMLFPHYNFFYSYPDWGTQWKNGKESEFHRVETFCHLCGAKPERNYAGIGCLYLLNNGIGDEEILVSDGCYIKRGKRVLRTKYVKNTPRLSPMILHCENCVDSYFYWDPHGLHIKKPVQLNLF